MSASLNGTVNNNSDVHDHDSDMHEHDSNTKIFLALLANSTTTSNSTSNSSSTSKPKVRDVDDVKSLNDTSEFDTLNSTERTAANATNQLRRRQVDVKALNDTDDALNSTKAGNETSQLRGIIIIKNRDVDQQEDEEDFLLEGPEGIEADDDNSTTTRPKLRDLDDVILKALNATEEDDEVEADNSTNKAWSNSRLQERAASTLNASLTSSNETRLNSTDMAATNKTVRAAGNETINGTDSQVNATTTTTASPWSILPFFRDLTKAKEEVNDTKETVDKLNTRSVFIVETLNDDIEDDASLDAEPISEPSDEDNSSSSNSTTTANPQDEN